jgi:hypothetical protein
MTDDDRAFVEKLCVDLEAKFSGVTAAHEGFKSSYLGGERDGFLVVEVFNVPDGRIEEVLRAGEALAFEHLMKGGGFVTFSLWTPEETTKYFQADLQELQRAPERSGAWHDVAPQVGRPWQTPVRSVRFVYRDKREAAANTELLHAA